MLYKFKYFEDKLLRIRLTPYSRSGLTPIWARHQRNHLYEPSCKLPITIIYNLLNSFPKKKL